MRCSWLNCRKRAHWHVSSEWDGTVVLVVCNQHVGSLVNAYPPGRAVVGAVGDEAKRKVKYASTPNRDTTS